MNHEYRQTGTIYRHFRTAIDLTFSLYQLDLDAAKLIVQCTATAKTSADVPLAEAEVIRCAGFLEEYGLVMGNWIIHSLVL